MLKLHGFAFAPNPRKLVTYMNEKGIPYEYIHVDLPGGALRTPEFRAINPMESLPVLELEDGRYLAESLAIIEYLEETHPDPPMIGRSPLERYHVRAMERLCEMSILTRVGRVFRNSHPMFAGPGQVPALADQARSELPGVLAKVDAMVGNNEFVAGDFPSIADCTLFATFELANIGEVEIDAGATNLLRWWESFRTRPSAQSPS
ncbi:MAG: glutathione S-transferase [Hyphomicrobiaceae bacterium]|jgi:glutathione S-transferase